MDAYLFQIFYYFTGKWLLKKTTKRKKTNLDGIRVSGGNINSIIYASNAALNADSEEKLNNIIDKIVTEWKFGIIAESCENVFIGYIEKLPTVGVIWNRKVTNYNSVMAGVAQMKCK